MYPELFTIPFIEYPVSSFGVMMSLGFLSAYLITSVRGQEVGLDADFLSSLLIWSLVGGVLGSKVYYTIDVGLRTGAPLSDLFFARAGITWYGGLMGGTLAGYLCSRWHGIPFVKVANAACPSMAFGQAVGRIGCFLVGDDYGRETDSIFGIAFPLGAPPTDVPVHPTQLYEAAWLVPVAGLLWIRRDKSPFLFGEYLALNGLGRIAIEHLRINPTVLGLTEPQWIGCALLALGVGSWLYFRSRRPSEAPA